MVSLISMLSSILEHLKWNVFAKIVNGSAVNNFLTLHLRCYRIIEIIEIKGNVGMKWVNNK